MDLFSSFKENFKNLFFNSLITGRSFGNSSSYEVVHCDKDRDFEEYAQKNHEVLNQILLVQKNGGRGGFVNGFVKRKGHSKNEFRFFG